MEDRNNLGQFIEQEKCNRGHLLAETSVYFPGRENERVCSQCRIINTRNWRKNNPERAREVDLLWKKNHPVTLLKTRLKQYDLSNEITV